MAERRSIGAALDMTPDKLAFIKGEIDTSTTKPRAKNSEEKIIEVPLSPSPPTQREPAKESFPRSPRRSIRRTSQEAPGVSQVLDQVLVPVTIRLPHRIAQSLRRAYLEQRLKHSKPDTQQEIVEEALSEWLFKQGFLE
jgi:hypothetical protein